MKILLVGRSVVHLSPKSGGGAEWHGYHLAVALSKLGHDVHYIANYKEPLDFYDLTVYNTYRKIFPKELNLGFNKWVLKHFKGNIFAAKNALSILTKEKNFDVIHCHGNLTAFILSKNSDKPVIYTEHDSPPWICEYRTYHERLTRKFFYYILNKRTIENVSHTITVSDVQKNFLINRWNISEDKITTIHNGVDTDMFSPNNNCRYIKEKYSLSEDYSIFVGRLEPRKCVDNLIKSMKFMNNISVIVGEGPDIIRLKEVAMINNVQSKIKFIGSVSGDDLRFLYSNAKFFVLPSISEGLPLTVLEAMASGIPIIASDVGGTSEIVTNGYNGFLIRPNDIDLLINAQQILMQNTTLRQTMGKIARETVEKNYSWQTIAKKTIDVYKKLIQ